MEYTIKVDLDRENEMVKEALVLPYDECVTYVRNESIFISKGLVTNYFSELLHRHPELRQYIIDQAKLIGKIVQ